MSVQIGGIPPDQIVEVERSESRLLLPKENRNGLLRQI